MAADTRRYCGRSGNICALQARGYLRISARLVGLVAQ
jgi:hypothetical protein